MRTRWTARSALVAGIVVFLGLGGALFERVLVDSQRFQISSTALWSDLVSGSQFHLFVVLPTLLGAAWVIASHATRSVALIRHGSRWQAGQATVHRLFGYTWPVAIAMIGLFGLVSVGVPHGTRVYPVGALVLQVVLQLLVTFAVLVLVGLVASMCVASIRFGRTIYVAFFALVIVWAILSNVGILRGVPYALDSYVLAPRSLQGVWCTAAVLAAALLTVLFARLRFGRLDGEALNNQSFASTAATALGVLTGVLVAAAASTAPVSYRSLPGMVRWIFLGPAAPTIICLFGCFILVAPALYWLVTSESTINGAGQRALRAGSYARWSLRHLRKWGIAIVLSVGALLIVLALVQLLHGWPALNGQGASLISATGLILTVAATMFSLTAAVFAVFLLTRSGIVAGLTAVASLVIATNWSALWGWAPFAAWIAPEGNPGNAVLQVSMSLAWALVAGALFVIVAARRLPDQLERI